MINGTEADSMKLTLGITLRTLSKWNTTLSTMNQTVASEMPFKQPHDLRILIPLVACCIFVFVVGVPGNAMVIYILGFRQRRQRKNNGNAFVVNLAVADFLASAAVPFVIIHDLIYVPKWRLGAFLCHFLPSLNPITLVASSWALVIISIDRYRFVKYDIFTHACSFHRCYSSLFEINICAAKMQKSELRSNFFQTKVINSLAFHTKIKSNKGRFECGIRISMIIINFPHNQWMCDFHFY